MSGSNDDKPLVPKTDVARVLFTTSPLKPALDGSMGINRVQYPDGTVKPPVMIEAANDLQAVHAFLDRHENNSSTYISYRKECYRLLKWCVELYKKPMSSLTADDMNKYKAFLGDPPKDWIANKTAPICERDGRLNEKWRPFAVDEMSPRSVGYALTVIGSMFTYLVRAKYLESNPVHLMKRDSGQVGQESDNKHSYHAEVERLLTEKDMEYVNRILPQVDPRSRWLFELLRHTGLRISEVAEHPMNAFWLDANGWWLHVKGKRGTPRDIPVSVRLLDALIEWRKFLNLTPLPDKLDNTPLVGSQPNNWVVSDQRLAQLVKGVFRLAADQAENDGPSGTESEARLRKASAHWLRHRFVSVCANSGGNLKTVQSWMGHSNFNTTAGYWHGDKVAGRKDMQDVSSSLSGRAADSDRKRD